MWQYIKEKPKYIIWYYTSDTFAYLPTYVACWKFEYKNKYLLYYGPSNVFQVLDKKAIGLLLKFLLLFIPQPAVQSPLVRLRAMIHSTNLCSYTIFYFTLYIHLMSFLKFVNHNDLRQLVDPNCTNAESGPKKRIIQKNLKKNWTRPVSFQ